MSGTPQHDQRDDPVSPTSPSIPAALVDWRELTPEQQWEWWNDLWLDAIRLDNRYRLALRTGWWIDSIQVETLHTLAAWVRLYDTGTWEDPPGKMNMLNELERSRSRLRAGEHAFDPHTDRAAFERHLADMGCPISAQRDGTISGPAAPPLTEPNRAVIAELHHVRTRRTDLEARAAALTHELATCARDKSTRGPIERELAQIERAAAQLRRQAQRLRSRIDND